MPLDSDEKVTLGKFYFLVEVFDLKNYKQH